MARRREWVEILTRCPIEGVQVQAWPDGHAPMTARVDGNDWVAKDGKRIPIGMGDVWRPLPRNLRRALKGARTLQAVNR